jgi:hypothetical protein
MLIVIVIISTLGQQLTIKYYREATLFSLAGQQLLKDSSMTSQSNGTTPDLTLLAPETLALLREVAPTSPFIAQSWYLNLGKILPAIKSYDCMTGWIEYYSRTDGSPICRIYDAIRTADDFSCDGNSLCSGDFTDVMMAEAIETVEAAYHWLKRRQIIRSKTIGPKHQFDLMAEREMRRCAWKTYRYIQPDTGVDGDMLVRELQIVHTPEGICDCELYALNSVYDGFEAALAKFAQAV